MTDELHDISEKYSLTAKQARAIGFLLTCRTVGDAAKKSGVTERTIFTWMKLENFRAALNDAGSEAISHTSRRLAQGQGEALDALSDLIAKAENESVRRGAAVDWLNLVLKYKDLNDIEKRLLELEKAVFDEHEKNK